MLRDITMKEICLNHSQSELAVYLAARYSRKNEIKEKAEELTNLGITVTSRWFNEAATESGLGNENYGVQDIEDIDACDILILFSEDPKEAYPRGGRHFESGYAFGKGKPVIVIGPIENCFH